MNPDTRRIVIASALQHSSVLEKAKNNYKYLLWKQTNRQIKKQLQQHSFLPSVCPSNLHLCGCLRKVNLPRQWRLSCSSAGCISMTSRYCKGGGNNLKSNCQGKQTAGRPWAEASTSPCPVSTLRCWLPTKNKTGNKEAGFSGKRKSCSELPRGLLFG